MLSESQCPGLEKIKIQDFNIEDFLLIPVCPWDSTMLDLVLSSLPVLRSQNNSDAYDHLDLQQQQNSKKQLFKLQYSLQR